MDYLAYLVKKYFPFLFPWGAAAGSVIGAIRFGRALDAAQSEGRIYGTIRESAASIVPLTEADAGPLQAFLTSLPPSHLKYFGPHGFDRKSLQTVLRSRAFAAYGLFLGEDLCGYALLKVSPSGRAFIGRLLAPELTGLGLGSFLSRYLYWQARLAKLRPASTISRKNLASLESHRAVGEFRIIKELPGDYLLIEFDVDLRSPPVLDVG